MLLICAGRLRPRPPNWFAVFAYVCDMALVLRFPVYVVPATGALSIELFTRLLNAYRKGHRHAMPSLDAIRAAATGTAREIAVPYGDAVIAVMFDPARVTGDMIARIQANPSADVLVEGLAALITSWDLTLDAPAKGKKATPYPPTIENLMQMPMGFLVAIMTEIGKDLNPTGEAGGSFAGG